MTKAPQSSVEELELSPKEKRKKKKEKKRKSHTIPTALKSTLPNEEPIPAESTVTEYPVEETTIEEEPAPKATVTAEYSIKEPAVKESAKASAPEASVAAEYPTDEPTYKKAATEGNFTESEICSYFHIQVSTKNLMFASPVFKKILASG